MVLSAATTADDEEEREKVDDSCLTSPFELIHPLIAARKDILNVFPFPP